MNLDFTITFVSLILLLVLMFVDMAIYNKTMKEIQVLGIMLAAFVPYLQFAILVGLIYSIIKHLTTNHYDEH